MSERKDVKRNMYLGDGYQPLALLLYVFPMFLCSSGCKAPRLKRGSAGGLPQIGGAFALLGQIQHTEYCMQVWPEAKIQEPKIIKKIGVRMTFNQPFTISPQFSSLSASQSAGWAVSQIVSQ